MELVVKLILIGGTFYILLHVLIWASNGFHVLGL